MASDEPRDLSPPKKRVPTFFVPSYAQVMERALPLPPPSLFRSSSTLSPLTPPPNPSASSPSQVTPPSTVQPPQPAAASGRSESFTEAFSFIKKTEFYSPPPAVPPPSAGPATIGGAPSTSGGLGPKQDVTVGQARNAVVVSKRQQGNPVLKHIKNVRWIFGDIVPDYLLGQHACALFLSLRYHLLHPDYIYFRIRELQKAFRLRVVLCYVDVEDVVKPLHEVTKTALLHDCSLLCAWSLEECARYLETLKIYENKPADSIQERTDHDYLSRLTSALKTIRHVNKTNVVTLGSTFGTLTAIMGASMEELARCPGIGERKVKRIYDAFHEPFRRTSKQVRLSSVGITTASTVKASNQEDQAEQQQEIQGTPKMQDFETPEVSVRKALDAAYVKYRPPHSERDENSKKNASSVMTQVNEEGPSG